MEVTYLDAVMAFFGLASIVIGSFADHLTGETLRARQAASTERQICQLRRQLRQSEQSRGW
jgi:hypothetical protein